MPGQPSNQPAKKKVSLAQKLGAKLTQAHNKAKDEPAKVGSARLPAGIEGGVAKLESLKIDLYEKGDYKDQPYFLARGTVISPETHEGRPIKGLGTQIGPIPLCNTPGKTKATFAEHYADFLNALKLLGVDTAATEGDMTPEEVEEFLNTAMAELVNPDNPPTFFIFRTWKGSKTELVQRQGKWYAVQGTKTRGGPFASKEEGQKKFPYADRESMVTEEWNGRCEAPEGFGGAAPMDDETGGPAPDEAPPEEPAPEEPEADEAPQEEPSADEGPDLDALVAAADKDPAGKTAKGKEACKALIDLALSLGIEKDAVTGADNWAAVAEMILEIQGALESGAGDEEAPTEDEEPPAEEPQEPVKGTVVKWCWKTKEGKPMVDPKTKKPLRPSDHEILSVNVKTQTVTLKNGASDKTVVGKDKKPHHIPWAELE